MATLWGCSNLLQKCVQYYIHVIYPQLLHSFHADLMIHTFRFDYVTSLIIPFLLMEFSTGWLSTDIDKCASEGRCYIDSIQLDFYKYSRYSHPKEYIDLDLELKEHQQLN
jgi:hypothetical protein